MLAKLKREFYHIGHMDGYPAALYRHIRRPEIRSAGAMWPYDNEEGEAEDEQDLL